MEQSLQPYKSVADDAVRAYAKSLEKKCKDGV
jgi:hypothetical protein